MDVLIGFVIALIGGIATTAVYVAIVWRLDRHEKEPVRMLALAFVWGMVPAVIISLVIEAGLADPLWAGEAGNLLSDAAVAPVVEESAKGLALLIFLVFFYREFDNVLDGIIYGAMIGFGFAFTENVLYVVSGVVEDGLAMGIVILFLRTVVFGLNHAFFSSLTGAGVGAARLTRRVPRRLLFIFVGWLSGVAFHSVHNLGTALAEPTALASLGVSLISDWLGVLMLLVIIVLVWRKEQSWMTDELMNEVDAGILTAEEYRAITSAGGRQRLLAKTLRQDGWAAYCRLGRQYVLFAELAFKLRQMRVMGEEPGVQAEITLLRASILREKGTGGSYGALPISGGGAPGV